MGHVTGSGADECSHILPLCYHIGTSLERLPCPDPYSSSLRTIPAQQHSSLLSLLTTLDKGAESQDVNAGIASIGIG